MKTLLATVLTLSLSSCTAWFVKDPPPNMPRGIQDGVVPHLGKGWVDLVAKEAMVDDIRLINSGGPPYLYALDVTALVGLRLKDYEGKRYWGVVDEPFTVRMYALPSPPYTLVDHTGGEVDKLLLPLSFRYPSFGIGEERVIAKPGTPSADPNNPVPPPDPTVNGALHVVLPTLDRANRPNEMIQRRAYLTSFLPPGTKFHLVVHADTFNDIAPEHDGEDPTDPNRKAPDFGYPEPANNEKISDEYTLPGFVPTPP